MTTGLLSDRDIRAAIDERHLYVNPYNPDNVQPCSLDVTLGPEFGVFVNHEYSYVDPELPQDMVKFVGASVESPFMLQPGEFVLASTLERIELPADIAGRYEGRSSLGRLGLLSHASAGFCDPGFHGTVTLELANLRRLPIALRPGMRIGQLCFFQLSSPADKPYGHPDLRSRYQNQLGVTGSRFSLDTAMQLGAGQ